MAKEKKALLVLEDGTLYQGTSFGAEGESLGEVVFNTSLTGYQEILTDPSYRGQIVTMTYPQIGNYGVNPEDAESSRPWLSGFVVKENSKIASNFRAKSTLDDYLRKRKVCGIQGIDTRSLTRHIRTVGALKGVISSRELDVKRLLKKVQTFPGLLGRDLVKEVTCKSTYQFSKGSRPRKGSKHSAPFVVVLDCGVKRNILQSLAELGCKVTVVPANTSAKIILRKKPSGVLLSNGPGDPQTVPYVVETVRQLIGKVPVFGICLGHQMLGLALGGKTYKLKFGHRGANQPVMHLPTRKVEITSHNHGYSVDMESLKGKQDVEITHVNLNDQTVEGFRHRKHPVFCVQYHPEACPGPHDAAYLFQKFMRLMEGKDIA